MRWKLKDTVAKCVRPRSGEGCTAWTFVMRKPQTLAQTETKQKGKKKIKKHKTNQNSSTKTEIVKQKTNTDDS